MDKPDITILTPLSLRTSWRFPLQSDAARREVIIGGLWLLVPFVGWLMNMGHRIIMVHNMMHGRSAWPAWTDPKGLLWHGLVTFVGMLYYYSPAMALAAVYWWWGRALWAIIAAAVLFVMATVAIPGYMSHYCREFDPREIFDPFRAVSRVFESGAAYWHAWLIALSALATSFVGLLGLGVGFLFTSVWFWQVAGFSFASVMTRRHGLMQER